MARPVCSRLTINHPSKNNSALCTCLFLHDYIQEQGYRSIRCCINGYKPKASAKNLNNCSATGALWSERESLQQNFLWRFHQLLEETVTDPLAGSYPRRASFAAFIHLRYKLKAFFSPLLQWGVAPLVSLFQRCCKTNTKQNRSNSSWQRFSWQIYLCFILRRILIGALMSAQTSSKFWPSFVSWFREVLSRCS